MYTDYHKRRQALEIKRKEAIVSVDPRSAIGQHIIFLKEETDLMLEKLRKINARLDREEKNQ